MIRWLFRPPWYRYFVAAVWVGGAINLIAEKGL
jgi:hypothetical protein